MAGFAHQERLALCDLFEQLGPHAPTLCEGWDTHDLAAHLVARETQPLALAGLVLPPVHRVTEHFEAKARRRPYRELVQRLRGGPPLLPLGAPFLRETGNLHEFFVHHEDVRRPNGLAPRDLPAPFEDALWRRTTVMAPYMLRSARGIGVVLERQDGRRLRGRRGHPTVVVHGRAGEIFLLLFNRKADALVTLDGPAAAVAVLRGARLGL